MDTAWNIWEGGSEIRSHKFDHAWTANPCDWLPCRRATLPLVGCPHSLVYLHLPVVEGLIFCISATPHLGTSFPLFHVTSGDTGHCVVTAGGDGAQQLRPVRVLQRQAAPQHLRQHHDQVRPTDRQPYKCTKVTKEIT